jgi:hypothetical protein
MSKRSDSLLFFGHSLQQYLKMFSLDLNDLSNVKLLDCMAGVNSVVTQMLPHAAAAVALDSLYNLTAQQIRQELNASNKLQDFFHSNTEQFNWSEYLNAKIEYDNRMHTAEEFFSSYDSNRKNYCAISSVSSINLDSGSFDLALSSHFLFTNSDKISQQQHSEIILEYARIANEVRVFPLFDKSGEISLHLGPVLQDLQDNGYETEIRQVDYELQVGANAMLVIDKKTCDISTH